MSEILTEAGTFALFENPPPPGFTLWHKADKPRAAWEMLGTFTTHYEAVVAMNGKGRFLILPNGEEP